VNGDPGKVTVGDLVTPATAPDPDLQPQRPSSVKGGPLHPVNGDTPPEAIITPENIPQEWLDILDRRAGKAHSRQGSVVTCLAEILNAALPALTARHNTQLASEPPAPGEAAYDYGLWNEDERAAYRCGAADARRKEREACAQLAERLEVTCWQPFGTEEPFADLIRARDSQ
jgi:hypothetical protein